VDLWRLTFCYVKGNLKNIFSRNIWRQKKKVDQSSVFQSFVHKSILAKVKLLPKAKSLRKLRKQGQKKKQKKTYPTIHTAVYAKKDQKMKKKRFS
jgi:hypothetical protein